MAGNLDAAVQGYQFRTFGATVGRHQGAAGVERAATWWIDGIGQYVAKHDGGALSPDHSSGLDILLAFFHHGRPSHRSCKMDPVGNTDGQNKHPNGHFVMTFIGQQVADNPVDQQCDQNGRKTEWCVK
jgi:hypothetical protein